MSKNKPDYSTAAAAPASSSPKNPKIRDWTEMMKDRIRTMATAGQQQNEEPDLEDEEDDDDGMDHGMLVPQVIMDDEAKADDGAAMEEEEVYEFCDVCDMELINHPDEEACPPHDGYVKVFQVSASPPPPCSCNLLIQIPTSYSY